MNIYISYTNFVSTLNSTYNVVLGESSLDFKLVEVSPLKDRGDFESFSLLFEATAGERLVQKTYTLEHSELGKHDIFLVPVVPKEGIDKNSHYYEAIFNRKKSES